MAEITTSDDKIIIFYGDNEINRKQWFFFIEVLIGMNKSMVV